MAVKKHWTNHEVDLLQKLWPKGGIFTTRPYLPNRTPQALRQKAHKLGIRGLNLANFGQARATVKAKLVGELRLRAALAWKNGLGTKVDIGKVLGVSRQTIARAIDDYERDEL